MTRTMIGDQEFVGISELGGIVTCVIDTALQTSVEDHECIRTGRLEGGRLDIIGNSRFDPRNGLETLQAPNDETR